MDRRKALYMVVSAALACILLAGCGSTGEFAFKDEFDGELEDGWTWHEEDPTHWSLSDVPDALRIVLLPDGYLLENAKNVLIRDVPSGDYEISTLVRFTPTQNYQFAGLVVFQDLRDFLQLGRAYCDIPAACAGNGIYFDSIEYGGHSGENFATKVESPSVAYLRLRREGNTYTGEYSEDGESWVTIGQHTRELESPKIGMIAHQSLVDGVPADFEYFTVKEGDMKD